VLGTLLEAGGNISLRPAMATVAIAYLIGLAATAAGARGWSSPRPPDPGA
jgi:hypothetical protein